LCRKIRPDCKAIPLITAVVKPLKLMEAQAALIAIGVVGTTVSEIKGFGR
jgi:nitrogen regulatory protein PII